MRTMCTLTLQLKIPIRGEEEEKSMASIHQNLSNGNVMHYPECDLWDMHASSLNVCLKENINRYKEIEQLFFVC